MRFISYVLLPEGASDEMFLWNIIQRTLEGVVGEIRRQTIIVSEVPQFLKRATNNERIAQLCDMKDVYDLFFVHFDSSHSSKKRLFNTLFLPIQNGAAELCGILPNRVVPVCTIREMESWALADPDAVARSCGFSGWPADQPLSWDPASVERIEDPKAILKGVIRQLLGSRPSAFADVEETLEIIARYTDLERLRRLDSYKAMVQLIREWLQVVGVM